MIIFISNLVALWIVGILLSTGFFLALLLDKKNWVDIPKYILILKVTKNFSNILLSISEKGGV